MPIRAQTADGALHEFPDGTDPSVIDKAMKSYTQEKVPQQLGAGGAFAAGMEDPIAGGRQLLAHTMGSPEGTKKIDEQIRQREEELKKRGIAQHGLARGLGEAVPGMAATLPLGGIGGVTGAALGGAATGLLTPETDTKDYLAKKIGSAATGAAAGAIPGGLMKGAGKALAPQLAEAQKTLSEIGVQMTPGQLSGPFGKFIEQYGLKNVPLMGYFVRNAENRSVEGFNIGAMNEALKPLMAKIPKDVKAGHDAMQEFDKIIEDAYQRVLTQPDMRLSYTAKLDSDIRQILSNAETLPEDRQKQLAAIINNDVKRHWSVQREGGENFQQFIDGQKVKDIESKLGQISRDYKFSSDPDQRAFGNSVADLQKALRGALTDQNPQRAKELALVNDTFAVGTIIQNAARRRSGAASVFSPQDLIESIKQADLTARDRLFRQGKMPLQKIAESGKKVLGSQLPNSGTPEQQALYHGIGGMAEGLAAGKLGMVPPLVAGIGAGAAAYSPMGISAANRLVQPAGAVRGGISDFLKNYSGYTGAGVSPIVDQLATDQIMPRSQ